jgi:Mrp family chromosome partitioning ATPase
VLLDTPPIGALADADLLSDVVDGVLLVVGAGRTGYRLAERAAKVLGRDRVLGVVLNGVNEADLSSAYADARYYAQG